MFFGRGELVAGDRHQLDATLAVLEGRVQGSDARLRSLVVLAGRAGGTSTGLCLDGDILVCEAKGLWLICDLIAERFQLNWRIFASCAGVHQTSPVQVRGGEVGAGGRLRLEGG